MNKKQQIVLGAGLLLVILNGLFPPFVGEVKGLKNSQMVTVNLGYHFIFRSPARSEVFKAMLRDNSFQSMNDQQTADFASVSLDEEKKGKPLKEATEFAAEVVLDYNLLSISSQIETARFLVQFVTIVGAIVDAFILSGGSNVVSEKK